MLPPLIFAAGLPFALAIAARVAVAFVAFRVFVFAVAFFGAGLRPRLARFGCFAGVGFTVLVLGALGGAVVVLIVGNPPVWCGCRVGGGLGSASIILTARGSGVKTLILALRLASRVAVLGFVVADRIGGQLAPVHPRE